MSTALEQLNVDMASMVGTLQSRLVQVGSADSGAGAGTIWHPDGLVLTNAHVVRGGPVFVTFKDGSSLPARVLARDADRDLAALAVDATGLPAIDLGASRNLKPGEWVLALGHPWGVVGAATAGVVIGAGHEWHDSLPAGNDWIVVSLHLRPGYSGGPLIDKHGRQVGINTMMTGPDVGVAVPVHVVKAFLRETLGSKSFVAEEA